MISAPDVYSRQLLIQAISSQFSIYNSSYGGLDYKTYKQVKYGVMLIVYIGNDSVTGSCAAISKLLLLTT